MTRKYGESRKEYAARQYAATLPAAIPSGIPVLVDVPCTCRDRPVPHFHSLEERRRAAAEWNSQAQWSKIPWPEK
jgi:hypothetical protein